MLLEAVRSAQRQRENGLLLQTQLEGPLRKQRHRSHVRILITHASTPSASLIDASASRASARLECCETSLETTTRKSPLSLSRVPFAASPAAARASDTDVLSSICCRLPRTLSRFAIPP